MQCSFTTFFGQFLMKRCYRQLIIEEMGFPMTRFEKMFGTELAITIQDYFGEFWSEWYFPTFSNYHLPTKNTGIVKT